MAGNIEIKTVETDSFSMEYFTFGHGDEVLVILPGLSVQSVMPLADTVADAYKVLADNYTVYLFDRRKDIPKGFSIKDMAHDTVEAFKALGLDSVYLMGASQGGMIAMIMAIEQPEMIKKLVLCSSSAYVDDGVFELFDEWIRLAEEEKAEELYLSFGENLYPPEIFEQSRGLIVESAKSVTREDMERFIIMAESIRGFDVIKDLKKIECPVQVIGSRDDRALGPDASPMIADSLDQKNEPVLYMYDGFGHAVYDTAPDVKERILEFLRS